MGLTFWERTPEDGHSNSSAGGSFGEGRGTIQFVLTGPQPSDLQTVFIDLLGDVDLNNGKPGDGRIKRTLPQQHPVMPSWYCRSVNSIQGVGSYIQQNALTIPNVQGATPLVTQFAFYTNYFCTAEFGPLPYAVFPDNLITTFKGIYTDPNGSNHSFTAANEWLRYTDFDIVTQNQAITAQQGQFLFVDTVTPPNGSTFGGMPRMFLPDSVMKFTWYRVPFRYYQSLNSYLTRFVGTINQYNWYNWKAGQLLYLGAVPRRYTPPVPKGVPWPANFNIGGANVGAGNIISTEKLCDLELHFLVTYRTSSTTGTNANANFVLAGHNLFPWNTDRKFHFVLSTDVGGKGLKPAFYSFPFALLFTDPDLPGNAGF